VLGVKHLPARFGAEPVIRFERMAAEELGVPGGGRAALRAGGQRAQQAGAGRGYLQTNGTLYQVTEQEFEHENGFGGRLWDLQKPSGTTYRPVNDRDGDLSCDCPDAVDRHHELCCKHVVRLGEAYRRLEERACEEAAAVEYAGEAPF
jgi:hypothetical protein